ncbi:hypothetical protein B9T07_03850 [Limnospira fusiformis CCALA 023]|nr:MAG: hypothetical protein EA414_05925 [Arthrospira sp. PLM2.Bin9]
MFAPSNFYGSAFEQNWLGTLSVPGLSWTGDIGFDDNICFRNVINFCLRFFTELLVTQKNFTKNRLQEWAS